MTKHEVTNQVETTDKHKTSDTTQETTNTIEAYHQSLSPEYLAICEILNRVIQETLTEAVGKVWHGHPVWFIEENPIVGYSKLKESVQMLFWSGQSFDEAVLKPEGKFKAANFRFTKVDTIHLEDVKRCLLKSREIQWDYKNIVKRKGVLERLK